MDSNKSTLGKQTSESSRDTSTDKLSEEKLSMESKGSGENLQRLTQPPNISVKKEREVAMNRNAINSDIPPASPAQPYGPGYYINNFQHMTPTQSRFIQNPQASPNDLPTRPSTPFQIPQFSSPMLSPASQIPRSYSPQRGFLPQRLYAQYSQAATGFTNSQLQQVQNHLISQGLIQAHLPLMQQQLSPIPLGVVSPPIIPPSPNPSVRSLKRSHTPKHTRKRPERKGSRNLYVANLPKDFSGSRLQEMFAPFGKITRSRVTNNASGHLSYAFVEFQNISDARNAILSLDNTQVDKETISVTVALQKTHSNPNLPPTNVYIRGTILKGCTMKEIHEIFGKFGKIVQARILNSKQGIVFVRFNNTHDASACINYYKTHSSEIENIGFAHRTRKQSSNAEISWNRPTIPTAPVNHERNTNSSLNMFQVPSQEDFDAVAGLESARSNTSNYSQGGTSVRVEELNILTLLLAKYWGSFGNVLFPMLFPETRMLISNPLYFQQRTTQMYTILKSREAKAKNASFNFHRELVKVNITGEDNDTGAKTANADFLPATPPTMTQSNYETRYWKDFKFDNIDFEAVQKEYGPLMMSTPTPLTECSSMSSLHNRRNLSAYSEAHYSNEAQLQALHLHGYSPSPIPHIPSNQGIMSGPTLPNLRSDQRADVPLQPMQMYRNAQYQSQPNMNDNLRQRSNSTPDLASSCSLTRTGPETSLHTPLTNPNDAASSSTSLRERREVGELKLQ